MRRRRGRAVAVACVAVLATGAGPAAAADVVPLVLPVRPLDAAASVVPLQERRGAGTSIASDVLFDFDRATLRGPGRRSVLRLAGRLAHGAGTLRVIGHTDGVGGDAYNRRLSLRRARAVAAALRGRLPTAVRVVASGRGAAAPLAAETTAGGDDVPEARARNRRVELRFGAR
ncbi:OmpA family protein [Patulibacter sp. SYSU D01012]|uniref:OmpA family protein n=1 Tax=Patulibacter sp. SYSU D01012 TaxID=2817381 RepID=UPI001B30F936|nr:OmpA family protein [Patulibacter sp. SYSU D01012]